MLFCSVMEGKRKDLLNPQCSLLSDDASSGAAGAGVGAGVGEERMCVLTELCSKYGGVYVYG